MTRRASVDPVWSARFAAQLLTGRPATSAVEVVGQLLAVQAQDSRGARLAVRARSTGLIAADVDRALDERRLVVGWLNRGTLHLVRAEDYWWLHALTTPRLLTSNTTRLGQEGVDPAAADRGVDAVVTALTDEGPLTRAALRERVAAAGVRTEGQALVHVLFLATLRGHVVRGPMAGNEQAFVLTRDWLGVPPTIDRTDALAFLARRYLRGHGPASDRDLARWAGVPLRDAREGLAAIADELVPRDDGLAALSDVRRSDGQPAPKLLGPFDPLLLGWTSRDAVLTTEPAQRLVTTNGLFRPFALVDGRAVATWSVAGGRVNVTPFAPLPKAVDRPLAREADDVLRFLARSPG